MKKSIITVLAILFALSALLASCNKTAGADVTAPAVSGAQTPPASSEPDETPKVLETVRFN
ncbi:MAG: hypothetical protein LBC78_03255, partial [Oscillospiraceae bacterium]|nr:hypothetical protein [Oscillospiraceae bacterium]